MDSFFGTGWLRVVLAAVLGGAMAGGASGETRNQAIYSFHQFGIEAGLPSNVARELYQSREGYLWIGTEAGLSRYDGVRLITYRHADTPGLPDNLIRAFFEEADGTLWVATQGGLTRYRHGQFEPVAEFKHKVVSTLAGDAAGNVWIGTMRDGLWRYARGSFAPVSDPGLLRPKASVFRLFPDSAGTLWIGLVDGGVVCWNDGRITQPDWGGRKAIAEVNSMAEAPRGTVWFSTPRGLYRLRQGELVRWGNQPGFGADNVTNVAADRAGRLWVSARGTVWVGGTEKDEFVNVPVPGSEFCRSVIEDREGSYWIGTAGDGVVRIRPSAFRMAYATPGNSGENVRSVAVDAHGTTWAGVAGKGLLEITPDGISTTHLLPAGLETEVNSVLCASDGSVWCGTRGATVRWLDGQLQLFPEVPNVRSLFQDGSGAIWCGPANRTVVRYTAGNFATVAGLTGPAYRSPTCFAEGRDGSVYIGFAQSGIARWKNGAVETYTTENGLPDPEVRALYSDADGLLWVGSKRRALSVRMEDHWFTASSLAETFRDLVTAIAEDTAGNIWFGTPKGLVWAPKAELLAVARGERVGLNYHVTGQGEGVPSGLIGYGTQPAWAKKPTGELEFVSRPGLLTVQPADLRANLIAPPVVIESLTVDGKVMATATGLSLPPGTRSIAIDYTALSFVQPGRVTFRYQLVGHDPTWVDAGARRTAFYTNLAPGSYRFRVVAANEDGVVNREGAALAFEQQSWFYQTWWFYLVVVTALLAAVAGMFRWRTAGLRRQVQAQTELIRIQLAKEAGWQAELERSSRLESLGLLAGGIAHDFNNLLTAIMGNLGLIGLEPKAMELVGVEVAAANRAAKRASEVTQRLLTFARGGDPVRAAVALPEIVREAAAHAVPEDAVTVECDFSPDLPLAWADAGQIGRVVHNLVVNAVQAMEGAGVLRIALRSATVGAGEVPALKPGGYLKLLVTDGGGGIPAEQLSRLFDPYYFAKAGSSGLGLATVHSIVKKHRGCIEVNSQVGKGTTFTVWLPEARSAAAAPAPPSAATPATDAEVAKKATQARVLVMDDEEVIRRLTGDLLARMGHAATLVADGAAALLAFGDARKQGRPFDLVVLDLTVPGGMGGRETIEALRLLDPEVKAIVSSGYSSDPVMANFRAHGFRAVVPKPYEIDFLARSISQVLQG